MFEEFPKISRLSRPIVITEKLDGSNGQLYIQTCEQFEEENPTIGEFEGPLLYDDNYVMRVGSRKRWLDASKTGDHFGFYKWAEEHFAKLCTGLKAGRHYGEWWGQGIQRGYGLKEKRFSLFNTHRWIDTHTTDPEIDYQGIGKSSFAPECCHVVPIVRTTNVFDTQAIHDALNILSNIGSHAAPGFMQPEGVVIFHPHGNVLMKKTFKGDEIYDPNKKRAD